MFIEIIYKNTVIPNFSQNMCHSVKILTMAFKELEFQKFNKWIRLLLHHFINCQKYCLMLIIAVFFFQSMLQDIGSHQRIVDSVVEKAQGVLQATSNPEVAGFIKDISSRYEHLAQNAKVVFSISLPDKIILTAFL